MLLLPVLAVLFASPAPETRFIAADVVNVRAAPSTDAPVVARLRINTAVATTSGASAWKSIAFDGAAEPVRGWVSAGLLGGHATTLADALSAAASATTPAERMRWAERAVAIDAGEKSLEALRDAAALAKRTERARHAEKALAGEVSALLAMCLPKGESLHPRGSVARVELLAIIDPRLGVAPVAISDTLLARASAAQWHVLTREGRGSALDGSPFATPRVVDGWNESAEPDALPVEVPKLVLGRCDAPGAVYSTVPLEPVARRVADASAAEPLRSAIAGKGIEARVDAAERVGSFVVARATGTWLDPRSVAYARQDPAYHATPDRANVWALLADGKIRERVGAAGFENDSVELASWAAPRIAGAPAVAIVVHTRHPQEDGKAKTRIATILLVRGDSVERTDVEIGGAGG